MPLDITPAAPADLPGILALLDASRLPRAGIEDHVATRSWRARTRAS